MSTKKQRSARKRNWNKLRLCGFNLNEELLTSNELKVYKEIKEKIELLKDNWEDGSNELGFNTKDRYDITEIDYDWVFHSVVEGSNLYNSCRKANKESEKDIYKFTKVE